MKKIIFNKLLYYVKKNNEGFLKLGVIFFTVLFSTCIINAQWERTYWYNGTEDNQVSNFYFFGDTIILNVPNRGILISQDFGKSWKISDVDNGFPRNKIPDLIVVKDNTIFISGKLFLIASTDFGETWQDKTPHIPELNHIDLLMVVDNNIIALNQSKGIFVSTDNGDSWLKKNNGLPHNIVQYIFNYGRNIFADLYVKQGSGVMYLSTDIGDTWLERNNGLNPCFSGDFEKSAITGENIYIGTYTNELYNEMYLSTDMGDSWKALDNSKICRTYEYSFVAKDTNLFLADFDSLYISTDKGESWINKGLELPMYASCLTLKDDYLYVAADTDVYRIKISDILKSVDVKEDAQISQPSIYPNPATNKITLKFKLDIPCLPIIRIF
ncbi:MAG TPA: hypothetical protein PKV40_02660, partial [Candidatus Kapabacteria bacterium]|nr:hypothetical protein [Candidatus Kapabacteria bacterium]